MATIRFAASAALQALRVEVHHAQDASVSDGRSGKAIDEVRPIRDRIRTEVQDLLRELVRPATRPT
ncbi:MAG: hypothetical protein ABGW95_02435 [Candidatus Poseidoniia archaeon]